MQSRNPPCDTVVLQDRDVDILRGLLESRVMTTAHIAAVYFAGRTEAAKKRLQRLKAAAFVAERCRMAFEPAAIHLSRKGLDVLRERGELQKYPALSFPQLQRRSVVSRITLAHELEVMDIKATFHSQLRSTSRYQLVEFTTWPLLNQFTASSSANDGIEVLVKPDGFIRIHEDEEDGGLSEHSLFLEVDRSTETLDVLVERAVCYFNYYRSGKFAQRNGGLASNYKEFPFRVMFVFKTAERRNNFAERLLHNTPPILTQVLLSVFSEVKSNPFAAIWMRPLDLRDAIAGTGLETRPAQFQKEYKRNTARDALLASRLKFQTLLS